MDSSSSSAAWFLSARTIDIHLREIFPRPGVGSRAELVRLELGA